MEAPRAGSYLEVFSPEYRGRTIMLMVFNFFQTIGFYGFGNWVPALLVAQGVTFAGGREYAAIIAIVYPIGPLVCSLFADAIERKWQIVGAACGTAIFGLLFWRSGSTVPLLILFGILITSSNNLLSYAYHAYQAELFPTRVRARAVGFVYSFSRLSTVFTSFMIGFFLQNFGNGGVFGPRTNGLALEEISAGDVQPAKAA
jgi:putative MFS transporter